MKCAQQHISTEISAHTHPTHLLHAIQAQVLLSTYLLRTKRFIEAELHANVTPPLLGVPVLGGVYPMHPTDAIEEGKHIRAFWAVACLQSHVNMSLDAASAPFCIFESPGGGIDTQDSFLGASPISTLHAKASVLLYRATRLGASWSPNLQHPELAAYQTGRWVCMLLGVRLSRISFKNSDQNEILDPSYFVTYSSV
ncbi:hypothetical protein B0H13DRAFT_2374181 [Mycena leptocephala]|nr:hypothetical protein B0H13DRAFT_2374181 [Mycena leptocephala]